MEDEVGPRVAVQPSDRLDVHEVVAVLGRHEDVLAAPRRERGHEVAAEEAVPPVTTMRLRLRSTGEDDSIRGRAAPRSRGARALAPAGAWSILRGR